ncbi:MAG: HAMP domain-containing histidine kinase [Firmicutes bacterium]|nr:HAMP domain-containing histidine kinase [Bacillota bacterium]
MKKRNSITMTLLFTAVILLFLLFLFHSDNKYNTKMPLPQEGTLFLTEETLDRPVFLIDDWRISDRINPPGTNPESVRTWIGEFPNYRRYNDRQKSPYGSATYRFRLSYSGDDTIVGLYFPNLCNEYTLWWDDILLSEGFSRLEQSLNLTAGEHTITIAVTSDSGYYSGMYFPGAIGSSAVIRRMIMIQSAVYGVASLIPLILASFCFSLWAGTGNRLRLHFALLCVSFSLSLSHYWLQFIDSSMSELRFLVSDLATYAMFYFALNIMTESIALEAALKYRIPRILTIMASVLSVVLYLISPLWPEAISLHGTLQNIFRVTMFLSLVSGVFPTVPQGGSIQKAVPFCTGAFGVSLLANLFSANQFEPIFTMWQYEWCAFFLVGLFAIMMEETNRQMLFENRTYQEHLEELVEQRTEQLTSVLEERRSFFSDMAHDLKAPLSSLKASIQMIRSHNVALDNELSFYLEQAEQQQRELSRRVGSLNELNAADRLTEAPETVSVNDFLRELYHRHNPEAVVIGVHLLIHPSEEDSVIRVQKKKLFLVFENLFYNALRFTPAGGSIIIRSEHTPEQITISIADTGCGISPEDLPHIFERFYVGQSDPDSEGSGLGLYIVQTILKELGAEITASSEPGSGSRFVITFPNR